MGIVNGVGGNNFNPSGAITREQLATILYRYSGTTPDRVNHLAGFADTAAISSYAKEPMNWAVCLGVLNGTSGNKLSPGATATRAQTAAMLIRYWNATAALPVPDTSVVS